MASVEEIDLIKMGRGLKPDVRYFLQYSLETAKMSFVQHFMYKPNQDILNHQKVLIDYAKNPDSHLAQMVEATDDKLVTNFYPDYDPLVIIYESSFYFKETFNRIKGRYHKLLADKELAKDLWERIANAHIALRDNTGFVSDDCSANNVLVKADLSDFKIIDLMSMHRNSSSCLDPVRFFLTHKYPKHQKDDILMEFLNQNVEKILGIVSDFRRINL